MITSTVSEQGQTTIPVTVRKAIKAPPGTTLAWQISGQKAEVVALVLPRRKPRDYDYLAHLKRLKESPPVPDELLTPKRSREFLS